MRSIHDKFKRTFHFVLKYIFFSINAATPSQLHGFMKFPRSAVTAPGACVLVSLTTLFVHPISDQWQCTNPQNIVRPLVAILPAWFRLAQCLRRYKDSRDAWPHLVNAGKYSTSIFVTIFSTVAAIHKGKRIQCRWLSPFSCYICPTASVA